LDTVICLVDILDTGSVSVSRHKDRLHGMIPYHGPVTWSSFM